MTNALRWAHGVSIAAPPDGLTAISAGGSLRISPGHIVQAIAGGKPRIRDGSG